MKKCIILASFIPALMGGCPPPETTDGIDLSVRGEAFVTVSRDFSKASVDVTANVIDRGAGFLVYQMLELSSTQVFQVNAVPLAHHFWDLPTWVSATIPAMLPPSAYTVEFNNKGTVNTMQATAVTEISIASPAAGTSVPKSGFNVTWAPSGDPGVFVDISIEGDVPNPDSSSGVSRSSFALSDRADNGSVAVPATDLMQFLPGSLRVTLTRHRTAPQALGFASGNVVMQARHEISLILVN